MNDEFKSHDLSPEGLQKVIDVKEGFDLLLNGLKQRCPESRQFSIVKTKLEEACFFAVKSVAADPVNQKVAEQKAA